ncbi:MAG: hypothetical protein AAF401_16805 [Pseudomonadota bacterium]
MTNTIFGVLRDLVVILGCAGTFLSSAPAWAARITETPPTAALPCVDQDLASHSSNVCAEEKLGSAMDTWAEKAAAGDADAAFHLGLMIFTGHGAVYDPARAEALLRQAAEADHIAAQQHLGIVLISDGRRSQLRLYEGLYWLGAAASQGDVTSAVMLGTLHYEGLHGLASDLCLAIAWFEAGVDLSGQGGSTQLDRIRAEGSGGC